MKAKDNGISDENGGMETTVGDMTEPSGLSPIFGSKGLSSKDLKNGSINLAKKASPDLDLSSKISANKVSAEGT